jgi:hypothetical protein
MAGNLSHKKSLHNANPAETYFPRKCGNNRTFGKKRPNNRRVRMS